jgi:hypothetical protein
LSKQQHQKHHQYHLPAHLLRILQQRWWIIWGRVYKLSIDFEEKFAWPREFWTPK